MASHWAIMPPMLTPKIWALSMPSAAIASAWSRAMSRVVYPSGRGCFRLKAYTVKSPANSRYITAIGRAVPFTVFRPSPRPGSIMSTCPPLPKRM